MPAPAQILFTILTAFFGPGPEAPADEAPDAAPIDHFDLALVRAVGFGERGIRDEIGLRLPDLELRAHQAAGDLSGRAAPYLYIEIQRVSVSRSRIAVIVSDGRAYYEDVEVLEGDAISAERVVASTLANLIFSIEEGSVRPDREDARIPPSVSPEPVAPPPEPPAEIAAPEPREDTEPSPTPGLEVGPSLAVGTGLGIGPPDFGDVYLGVGASLGLQLRTARGFFGILDFRPSGRSTGAYRLTRLRVALGAGYAWRGQRVEIATAVALGVEPWFVTTTAGIEPIRGPGNLSGQPPLLSALLRLSPGYHLPIDRGALRGLRIGPRIEIGGGFVIADGAKVAGLRSDSGEALFRLGGVELATGFEIVGWFGSRTRY